MRNRHNDWDQHQAGIMTAIKEGLNIEILEFF